MLTIYSTPLSANGRKVLALKEKVGFRADVQTVNVYRGEGRTSEYLSVNSTGKIPCVVDDEFTLAESNAILIYLSEKSQAHDVWPPDARVRARITQWLFWESAHWQPVLSKALEGMVAHRLFPQSVTPSVPEWDSTAVKDVLRCLESALKDRSFLAGDSFSLADISVGGMATYFRVGHFPFAQYPAISQWYGRLEGAHWWRATAATLWTD
jgi:glutathione S-transferase